MPKCKDHTPEEEQGTYWCEGCSKEVCGNCKQFKHQNHELIIITQFVQDVEQQVENYTNLKFESFCLISLA